MDQEAIEANNRLLEKRKATEQSTPSMSNAQSEVTKYTPKCMHGVPYGTECHECKGLAEKVEQEQQRKIQEKEREREERRLYRREHPEEYMSCIPKKFRGSSLDIFKGGDLVKNKCREFIEKYSRNIKKYSEGQRVDYGLIEYPGSLIFTGPTGCGKTHLAVATYRELIRENRDGETLFTTAPELLLEIRATFNAKKNIDDINLTEEQVIDKYSKIELLILDDLGSEKTSEFAISSFYLIIDRRNRNLKPTIITTNLSLKEIEEKLDARIASRLADMAVIKINMPDYRKKR